MPRGAAGGDDNLAGFPDLLVGQAHLAQVDGPILDHRMQGIRHCLGLLVNFLHHEVLKARLLRRLGVPVDADRLLAHFLAVQVVEMRLAGQQPGEFVIADVIDLPGVLENCRHVGGHIGLPVGDTDDHGAFLPGHPDLTGVILEHQLQGVGAADTHHGLGDGINGANFILFIVVVHQLDHHLCVGLAVELVAVLEKLLLQLGIVFDDAVVDAHHLGLHAAGAGAGAVAGDMGMGIDL